jgi:hypothetical protein
MALMGCIMLLLSGLSGPIARFVYSVECHKPRAWTQGLDILFTPISHNHLLMFAGSNLTHEPTWKQGMVPRFARRRIVNRETLKKPASCSAVIAVGNALMRDARDFSS